MMQRYILLFILSCLPFLSIAQSVEYVRNDGQWDGPFQYLARTGKGDVFLSTNFLTYLVADPANPELVEGVRHGQIKGPVKLKFHTYKVSFEGGSKPVVKGSKEQSWYNNYFLGNDKSKWKTGIHPALSVDYTGLYAGIDMHFSSEKGNIKYEFVVAPGADPNQIRLKYEGADELKIKNGNLYIKTSVGEVQELKPYTFQNTETGRKKIDCRYHLKGNVVTYDLGEYDATKTLIIDPSVVFATFSGSTADNWGFTATYDLQGNFYAGGFANPTAGAGGGFFPTTPGAFQSTFAGGFTDLTNTDPDHGSDYASDITVMKFNPSGTNKIYATYIGGNDNDQPHSMIVDANNNLLIAGRTYSNNFPVTTNGFDTSHNGKGDIVVVKLNATGTGLIGSTYVGGVGEDGTNFDGREPIAGNLKHNYGDDARSEVLIDNSGFVYVTASTKSTDFPVTSNAFQATSGGAQDGVVFKLNPTLSSMIWSTYIGGSADDAGYVLALDNSQANLYVAGGTQSSNFPALTGGWKPGYQGGIADGYILKFTNSGNYPLTRSTFIGMNDYDQCFGVQVDLDNNVYAMGQTLGGTFPVTSGVYSNPGSSQFIIKLNPNLTTNIYSTVFGSGNSTATNISPVAFLVDTCQNVYISGWGGKLGFNYPGVGDNFSMPMSVANLPAQSTTDGNDFYFFVLSKNAQTLLYSTYMGGTSAVGEHVDGGTSRFDKNGVVYQAICGGCGGSSNFPTTPGSWSVTNAALNCNLIAVKIAFNLGAVEAGASASPTARGCPPLVVQFQNNSTNATSYTWDFRDGSPISTQQTPPAHTFSVPGIYDVRLIAFNPNACKTLDTSYVRVTVDSTRVRPSFTATVTDSCGPWAIAVNNTSQYSSTPGSSSFTTFTWLWGDGNTAIGTSPGSHAYSGAGTYTVKLVMRDTSACNSPDTVETTIALNGIRVTANFNVPDSLCEGSAIAFTDNSTNATGVTWTFGDGRTSTQTPVIHTYDTAGTYTVKLVSVNPNSCNKRDSMTRTITIFDVPTANFTHAPVIPIPNTPIDFTNTSIGATDYFWNFGDNTNSTAENPSHLYRKSGRYTVCLTVANKNGCTDTVCKTVEADILTRVEVPSAFSPNGDGKNDRFYARGGGIEFLDMKIFNRWGQLIFEKSNVPANDPVYGWDGTFKGKDQEMEAYAYVLNVTFIDGSTAQRKGNVTLVR